MATEEQKKGSSNIFEYSIGNIVKTEMRPLEGKKVSFRIIYHLTYAKKRSQDLVVEDVYTCGDDPTGTLTMIQRHFDSRYHLKLRGKTIKKIEKTLGLGCIYLGKLERSEQQAAA